MKPIIFLLLLLGITATIKGQQGLEFIQNKGQWPKNVLYKASLTSGAVFLEKDKLTIVQREVPKRHTPEYDPTKKLKGHSYQILFENAHPQPDVRSSGIFPNYYNYFLGNDSSQWAGECKAYEMVTYYNIYPKTDLKIYSEGGQLKYSFLLHPGADVSQIALRYSGVEKLSLDPAGNLLIPLSMGYSTELKPLTLLHKTSGFIEIKSRYKLEGNLLKFEVEKPTVDSFEILEIDPTLIFSSFSGSTSDNFGATATYDFQGNLYGSGLVFNVGYPTTVGAFDLTFGGQSDIGITKFNQNGTSRIYSTYLGGNSYDMPHSLIVDQNGRLILLGTTSSLDYPTTLNAFDRTFNGGPALVGIPSLNGLGVAFPNGADIVITKFNSTGSILIGSTYFGGSGTDGVGTSTDLVVNYGDGVRGEILVDTLDQVFIATLSNSTNLPTTPNAFQTTNAGLFDGVLAKFNTNLTQLLSCTYYGGNADDALYDICFDKNKNIIGTGGTASANIPTTPNVLQSTYSGNRDGFVIRIDPFLGNVSHATYTGTSSYDQNYFVEINDSGQVHLLGQTNVSSGNYYILNSGFNTSMPTQNNMGQYILVLNENLSQKVRSMTFGRNNQDPDISPTAFLVDYCNKIFVTGWGSNLGVGSNQFSLGVSGMPLSTAITPFQSSVASNNGMYLMVMNGDLSQLYYSTFYGGLNTQSMEHVDGGTCRFDKNGIVYHAVCAGCGGQNNFTIQPSNVVGPTNLSPNCNLGVFKFDFGLPVKANFESNSDCAPGNISFTNLSHSVGANNNVSYQWDFGNGNTSTLKNPTNFYALPGIYQVRLIVQDLESCNIRDTIIKPVLVLGYSRDTLPTRKVCLGNSTRIGFPNVTDPNISIVWTPSATIDDPNILAPYASPSVTTNYQAIVTKGNCIDTFIQKVEVELPIPITISGPNNLCSGVIDTFLATNFPVGTYSWQPSQNILYQNRDSVLILINQPTTLSVLYTSEGGCISSATKSIGIVSPNVSLSSTPISCVGSSIVLSASSSLLNNSYEFFPSNLILSTNGNSATAIVDTTRWFYVESNIGGLCRARDSFKVDLLEDKISWTIDSTRCRNTTVDASATPSALYQYRWQPSARVLSGQNTPNPQFILGSEDVTIGFEARLISDTTCRYSDSTNIYLLENNLTLNAKRIMCKDSLVRVRTKVFPDVNYQWQPASQLVSFTGDTAVFSFFQTRYFTLTATDNSGCIFSDSVLITVSQDLFKLFSDSSKCPGDTFRFGATPIAGTQYQWFPATSIIGSNTNASAEGIFIQSQWVYVQIIDSHQCYKRDSVEIKVLPPSSNLAANFTYPVGCANLSIPFTNTTQNASSNTKYKWTIANIDTFTQTNPTIVFPYAGLYSVKLVANDSLRCNIVDTIEKNVLILNNQKFIDTIRKACIGDTSIISLNISIDSIQSISWFPNSRIVRTDTTVASVFPISNTQYTAIVTKGFCVDTFIFPFELGSPKPINISGEREICALTPQKLLATFYPLGTYSWLPANALLSSNRDSATFYISQNPFEAQVNYISEFNCKSSDTHRFLFVLPQISYQSDTVACPGEILRINFNSSMPGGAWSILPSASRTDSGTNYMDIRIDSSHIFQLSYQLHPQCRDQETIPIRTLKDAISLSGDSIICGANTAQLTASQSPRWQLNWQPQSALLSGQGSSPAMFSIAQTPLKVTLNATLLSRPTCQAADSISIFKVKDKLRLIADQTRCRDSGVQIFATYLPGYTYSWTPANLFLFRINDTAASFRTDTSRYYYLTVRDRNGCEYLDSIFIQIVDNMLRLQTDSVVCPLDTFSVRATPMAGAVYQWAPASVLQSGQGTPTAVFNPNSRLQVTVRVQDTNGCVMRDTVDVLTLDNSLFRILNTDTVNCRFDTLILRATRIPSGVYSWSPASLILSGQGTPEAKSFISADQVFFAKAQLSGRNCEVVQSINIKKDTQFLRISVPPLACLNDTFTAKANFNPRFTYNWQPQNFIQNRGNEADYILDQKKLILCQAISNPDYGCIYRDSSWVDYTKSLFEANATATPPSIEYGDTTQLNIENKGDLVYFLWSPKESLSSKFVPNPLAWPKDTTMYIVQMTDRIGCRSADTVIVPVYYEVCGPPEIFVPTGFTPNSNGANDLMYVRGDNILEMHFEIYDRWGQKMWETRNQKLGWDGRYKGVELEPGVFAYKLWALCIGGAVYEASGNITLIK